MAEIKPFTNTGCRRKLDQTSRIAAKAFNVVAEKLMRELARMYPTDAVLKLIWEGLTKYKNDPAKFNVPSLNFFREIRKKMQTPDGKTVSYVDLLAAHDPLAFNDPIPVSVLQGAGLANKWKCMGAAQRNDLWQYVDKLIELSAKSVFSGKNQAEFMDDLSSAVMDAMTSAPPGKQVNLESVVLDPVVQERARTLISQAQ